MNRQYAEPQHRTHATTASTVVGERSLSPTEEQSTSRRSVRRKRGADIAVASETFPQTLTNGAQSSSHIQVQTQAEPPSGPSTNAPPTKRARTSRNAPAPSSSATISERQKTNSSGVKIEEINLIDVDDEVSLQEVLSKKKQEELLKQQNDEQEKPKLANFKCVICLDDPTDLATTPCGHMFCDFCLRGALKAGQPANTKSGRCPVCRRKVNLKDVVVLEIKKSTRAREKGKGKARQE